MNPLVILGFLIIAFGSFLVYFGQNQESKKAIKDLELLSSPEIIKLEAYSDSIKPKIERNKNWWTRHLSYYIPLALQGNIFSLTEKRYILNDSIVNYQKDKQEGVEVYNVITVKRQQE